MRPTQQLKAPPRIGARLALILVLPGLVPPAIAQHAVLAWRVRYSDLALQVEVQARGTPVAVVTSDEGVVLVEWVPAAEPTHPTDSSLTMLARETGALLWRRRLSDCHVLQPMVAGELLIVRTSVGLAAIELADGGVRWDQRLPVQFPFSFLAQGAYVLASGDDGAGRPLVICLDLASGAVLWQWHPPPLDGIPGMYLVSAAAVDRDLGVAWLGLYGGQLIGLHVDSGMMAYEYSFRNKLHGLLNPRAGLLIAFDGTEAAALTVPELRLAWTVPALWPEDRLMGRLSPLDMPAVCTQQQLHIASRAAQRLASFDLQTGQMLWATPVECSNPGYQLLATAAHTVVVSTVREAHLTQLDWFDALSGQWVANLEVPQLSYSSNRTAAADSDAIYAATWQYIAKAMVVP